MSRQRQHAHPSIWCIQVHVLNLDIYTSYSYQDVCVCVCVPAHSAAVCLCSLQLFGQASVRVSEQDELLVQQEDLLLQLLTAAQLQHRSMYLMHI